MKQCPCGKYYLDRDTICPFCGYTLSKAEWKAHLKELKAARRGQEVPQKQADFNSPKDVRERQEKVEAQREFDGKRAVSAVLIGTSDRRSALSTVTRALVGGAFLGPVGAIGGAASGMSQITHATFSVKYANGRTATETVEIRSKRFRELSALLHN